MKINPPGAKLLRSYYKAKTGERGTYEQAARHYAQRQEPRFRAGASQNEKGMALLVDALSRR